MRRGLLFAMLALSAFVFAAAAHAEPLADDGGAEWRLEQPSAPEPPPGVEPSPFPVGLGSVGDIEFYAPNRGALITRGNGSTVPPGVWIYNGVHWRELSTVCGATDGRIAWAGPDEFWTVSDKRPGQAPSPTGVLPPLEDNSLCHFAAAPGGKFEVVGSYATLGFLSTSYLPMHGAACLAPDDCWFGGDPLQAPALGAFQLHWNGHELLTEPYGQEGHAVAAIAPFEGSLFESLELMSSDRVLTQAAELPALRRVEVEGATVTAEPLLGLPLYGPRESPYSLDSLRLSSSREALWAAAGPSPNSVEGKGLEDADITVARLSRLQYVPSLGEYSEEEVPRWSQVLGPESTPQTGLQAFGENAVLDAIGAEPETHAAWLALDTVRDRREPKPTSPAMIARVAADGSVSDRLELPEAGSPTGAKGAAKRLVCPALHECWMVTSQGWLFHLSVPDEATGGAPDRAFAEEAGEVPLSFRPQDEGTPQAVSDAPPEDTSGSGSEPPTETEVVKVEGPKFATIVVPLISGVRSHLVHGTTLQLSFRLSVKASVQLVAKRRGAVVAKTPNRTFRSGKHSLLLRLNPHRWPTKLDLKTHALEKLRTTNTRESNVGSVSTSEVTPFGIPTGWNELG